MNIIPIEALQDNYMYLIVDESTKECAAVDPVDPKKVHSNQRLFYSRIQIFLNRF